MFAQKVVNLLKYIALELKFLIETQDYKCRFAKDVNVVNEFHHSNLKDFENDMSHKIFNFYAIRKVNIRDF